MHCIAGVTDVSVRLGVMSDEQRAEVVLALGFLTQDFGYTEAQAKERGYDVKVAKFPFSANGKAQGLGETVIEPRVHLHPNPAVEGHFNVLRGAIGGSGFTVGLTPLEAGVFGKPVAALRAGGYLDSVVEGRSGVFFDEARAADIARALDEIEAHDWDADEIIDHAASFGEAHFHAKLDAVIDEKVEKLKAIAPNSGTAMILLTNAGKVGVYGPSSRTGWLHTEIGFKPVAADIDDRFDRGDVVSFEYLAEANPEWLFVIDRDAGVGRATDPGKAAAQVLDNELIHQTNAWKKKQIVYLDPQAAYIVSSGYTALTTLLDQVYKAVSEKKS